MAKKVQANRSSPSPRSLRALILEDNRQDVERMVALLKGVGYALSFEVVDSLAHLQQQLARADYDIILADHNLRTWTAMDALEILKKSRKDVPFVVVAGTLGGLAAVECIKQGAADYVLKHRLQRLPVVVERVLRARPTARRPPGSRSKSTVPSRNGS
jgi:DNA-binding NtrC family response regulator